QYSLDECGSTCFDLPNAQLNPVDCAITWTPVLRSEDIANGLTESTYVVAITAEDFVNASSTTPLSSVPHQILVHVSYKPANACSTRPSITGLRRRNLACYALSVGYTIDFIILSTVTCTNDSIVEFISTSPFDIFKTDFYQEGNYTWGVNVTWTPLSDQTDKYMKLTKIFLTLFILILGLQPFCIAAVDNNGQTSNQYCVMIAVGVSNPYIIAPSFVQSTASPVGTVMATQSRFSIQSYNAWRFTIWNPAISSTTTPSTTTTTATTHTVTTRFLGTTTYNTHYTTTGIPAYTTSTTTSTTSTTSTSATTTTTTSATTATTSTTTTTEYNFDADVIYPKDMERACLQPVTIATALVTIAVIPLHFFGMITLFVKMNSHYQNGILRARTTRRKVLRQALDLEEQETLV
ncbi:unnamed protein product, partial [Rotaria sp. Silwood2]